MKIREDIVIASIEPEMIMFDSALITDEVLDELRQAKVPVKVLFDVGLGCTVYCLPIQFKTHIIGLQPINVQILGKLLGTGSRAVVSMEGSIVDTEESVFMGYLAEVDSDIALDVLYDPMTCKYFGLRDVP